MTIPTNNTKDTNLEGTNKKPSNKQGLNKIGELVPGHQSVDFPYKGNTQNKGTNKKDTKKGTNRKKIHALDVYIIFCFICIIIYTVIHTLIFYKLGVEAVVLDALFYGVFGGEMLLCALLKRLKLKQEFELTLKKNDKDDESEFVE